MNIESILNIIVILLNWRTMLSFVITSLLGFALVAKFSLLTGIQGLTVAGIGFFIGLVWEESRNAVPAQSDVSTTTAVYNVSFALIGVIWGLISSSNTTSLILGLIILLIGIKVWSWYAKDLQCWVTTDGVYMYTGICILTYAVSGLVM